jgi:hypothetical protein
MMHIPEQQSCDIGKLYTNMTTTHAIFEIDPTLRPKNTKFVFVLSTTLNFLSGNINQVVEVSFS